MTTSPPFSPVPGDRDSRYRRRIALRKFLSRCRRLLPIPGVLLLAIFGLMAYNSRYQARQRGSAQIEVPNPKPFFASPIPELREIVGSFQRNQTITQVMLQQGLPLPLIHQIIDSTRPVYDLAKVKAEQLYWLCFTPDGKFSNFRYPVDDERYLTVYHDKAKDSLVPVMKNFAFETRIETVSAVIDSSLFAAVLEIGEKDQLALDMADIFGSDVDFNTDIQKGDSFRVRIERKFLDGQFSKNGAILAASFTNEGKEFAGIRYEDEHGKPAYYAPDGKALKKSFLKSPLKFGRITSKFSHARLHPILKIVRPHLGVDYAAPAGTPVQSVAAGLVTGAGYNGGGGRTVTIRHASGYETKYLHLSRIAVRVGARVDQGNVIGTVGSTGLATGPHLDFRINRNGKAVNPAKVIFPPGLPVAPARFADFAVLRDQRIAELRLSNDDSRLARR